MAAGFCHGVLNTDNMSITGESFDYGPYAFIETYNLSFTAAYFDYFGLYAYGNQPAICRENLLRLQRPLELVIAPEDLQAGIAPFWQQFEAAYQEQMLRKLGFRPTTDPDAASLVEQTVKLLKETQMGYHTFFAELSRQFSATWRDDLDHILPSVTAVDDATRNLWQQWKIQYFHHLLQVPPEALSQMGDRLQASNPSTVPVRPLIEAAWKPIVESDDWSEFELLIRDIRA
jgi:uncharacterized protein YdiU (UPF0061 family)